MVPQTAHQTQEQKLRATNICIGPMHRTLKKTASRRPLRNPIKDTGGDAPNNSRKPRAFLLRSHHQPCTTTVFIAIFNDERIGIDAVYVAQWDDGLLPRLGS